MSLCNLGNLGGLLFLGIFAGTILLAVACLILGAIGARWFDDVNQLEAIQKRYRRDDL